MSNWLKLLIAIHVVPHGFVVNLLIPPSSLCRDLVARQCRGIESLFGALTCQDGGKSG